MRKFSVVVTVIAVASLVAVLGAGLVLAGTVAVAEDDVEWAAANGDVISSIRPNVTGVFFIFDDALETTKSGTGTWSATTATVIGDLFSLANGFIKGASTTGTYVLTSDATNPYNTVDTSVTPLTGNPSITINGFSGVGAVASTTAGTFSLNNNTSQGDTVVAAFNYHIRDVWDGQDASLRRAKVTSTSDPQGEWVTISEVASVGSSTASPTSRIFRGEIVLSSNAALQGTSNDDVWVQDGDTLTATYYNSAGAIIDTDTVTVDGVKPTIANIVPADGIITNVANPTVRFDVTDTGSGISTTNLATDITLKINGVAVSSSSIAFQAIANGFRANFAQGTSWLNSTGAGGFNVSDSLEFSLTITATDKAGNTQTVSGTSANVTIDKTKPVLSSAKTGSANTAVVVTFSDTSGLDAASIDSDGSDFTVAGATVSAAAVDANDKNKANLTVSALASDALPQVTVSGTILDKAGNAVAANSQITAPDGISPSFTSITIDKALAIKDDVVTVALATDEKMAAGWPRVSIVGPAGATSNGLRSVTSPTPNNFSAATPSQPATSPGTTVCPSRPRTWATT